MMGGGGPGGAMMRGPAEKAKDVKGTLKRLLPYLASRRMKLIVVFILAIASTVFSIVGPKIMGKAITKLADGFLAVVQYIYRLMYAINTNQPASAIEAARSAYIPQYDMQYIGRLLLLLAGLYVLSALLSFIMSYLMSGVSQNIVYDMRNQIKEKLDRLPLKYYDARTHGEILSRVTNDMDNIATTLQQSLTQLITSVATILGVLCMMFSISPLMTLIALVTLPLSVLFTLAVTKNSQKFYVGQQKAIGELNGHVEEMYTGHKAVKVFNHEEESIAHFQEINDRLYDVGWKAQFMSGLIQPALNFVSNLGYVFVCILGGVLVARRSIEVGDVQAFIQYMRTFTMPIVQTANIANILQGTIASAERVFEVLDEPEEKPETDHPVTLAHVDGHVEFEHVVFGYSSDNILMRDMNIEAKTGQTVAIVGPTGAGKTTMVNLLMRFYEVNGGQIKVDGVNITDMRRGDLRKIFGMVLQDTWLFNGTIFDNIKYGKWEAGEEQVYEAARAAHADHFIRGLPGGYQTILNEEASNISQGQRQLLTIARAILSDPAILILDEATSNVDTRTEVLIQKAMDNLMHERTSFVIAHRLSTIKNADLILVMSRGAIIEQGNHQQLMDVGGFYADLYNSQFAEEA
ncbi:MAG: ABC transporter ATP-binding protein/permease [Clostridiales bacterium]|nr:ABC transporter ATP-binding protein/permease [Clostridiales bacterium]